MRDPLGDEIKERFERPATSSTLSSHEPVIIRLDGRAFHTFTKGMKKPYDERVGSCLMFACAHLVGHFKAEIGYCQSDEITLVLTNKNPEVSEYPFAGKIQKLASVTASMATSAFMQGLSDDLFERLPHFDGRVFNVPTLGWANKVLLWRERDARRNAVSALGHHLLGKKACHGLKTKEIAERCLKEHNAKPEDYGNHNAYGTYYARVNKMIEISEEDRLAIPEKHRPAPGEKVQRSFIQRVLYDPRLYEEEYG